MTRSLLTKSALGVLRLCPRAYSYSYAEGVRLAEPFAPAEYGTLAHGGLERVLLRGWAIDEAMRGVHETAAREYPNRDADPYMVASIDALLTGYLTRWRPDAWGEIVGVEQEFRIRLRNPDTGHPSRHFDLGGKVDVLVRRDGEYWIPEHKTTGGDITPGGPYWQRLEIDTQISLYTYALRQLGFNVAGVIYDVLQRPSIRPYKATPEESRKYTRAKPCKAHKEPLAPEAIDASCTDCQPSRLYANQRDTDETPDEYRDRIIEDIANRPNEYYARLPVRRTDDELTEALRDAWSDAHRLRGYQKASYYPRNPDGCFRYGRPCDYYGVCTGAASLDDPAFVRTEIHPELNDVSKEETNEQDRDKDDWAA